LKLEIVEHILDPSPDASGFRGFAPTLFDIVYHARLRPSLVRPLVCWQSVSDWPKDCSGFPFPSPDTPHDWSGVLKSVAFSHGKYSFFASWFHHRQTQWTR